MRKSLGKNVQFTKKLWQFYLQFVTILPPEDLFYVNLYCQKASRIIPNLQQNFLNMGLNNVKKTDNLVQENVPYITSYHRQVLIWTYYKKQNIIKTFSIKNAERTGLSNPNLNKTAMDFTLLVWTKIIRNVKPVFYDLSVFRSKCYEFEIFRKCG